MKLDFTNPLGALRWTLTVAWAALIFYLSTRTFNSDITRGFLAWTFHLLHIHVSLGAFNFLHALLRKLAHLTEYGIFALLLYGFPGEKRRVPWQPRRAAFCILGAALYSLTDEFHQLWVPGRHGSPLDCGLDTLGAALAMLVPYTQVRMALLKVTRAFPDASVRVSRPIPGESESGS